MNRAQKLAATEQQARTRTVHGWAFRQLPDDEKQAIKAFLDGGACPASYHTMYTLARQQLKLPPAPLMDWTRADGDGDLPTWQLTADTRFYVEKWGLGAWAAYFGDIRIGEPGSYGTRDEAQAAAETGYRTEFLPHRQPARRTS